MDGVLKEIFRDVIDSFSMSQVLKAYTLVVVKEFKKRGYYI